MKNLIAIFLLAASLPCGAIDTGKATLSPGDVQNVASAIYKLEGGSKTKYPYGIRSINTNGDVAKAKRICENTIKNNFARWNKTNKKIDFLDYLANVYCPSSADRQGNINWKKNIHKLVK